MDYINQIGKFEMLVYGICIGFVLMSIISTMVMRSYIRVLQVKAHGDNKTPEKLNDGKFYYIVPEKEYNDLVMRGRQFTQFIDNMTSLNAVMKGQPGGGGGVSIPTGAGGKAADFHSGCGDPLCGCDIDLDAH